jgi:GNAT superfamily N-acetyltransferase
MVIRHSSLRDWNKFSSICREFFSPLCFFLWREPSYFKECLAEKQVYKIQKNKDILAFIILEDNLLYEEDCLHIALLAINREFQGKGIGKKLISFAEKLAVKKKRKYLLVESYNRFKAVPFYKKMGFSVFSTGMDGKNKFTVMKKLALK